MNRRNKRITTYFILFGLLIVMGVVFAVLQANLQINGTAKITQNSWRVYFDNIVVNPDSVPIGTEDIAATIDPTNNCKVDFSVTLSLPGDFYEFTVDVVNGGSIDAMIGSLDKSFKINNLEAEIPDYLNYRVTYDGGDEILEKHLLEKNSYVTYKVRVEFKTDIDAEDLPDATTISMSVEPTYVQADDTAIKKKPFYACTYNGELIQGAEYTNGQYTYRYMQEKGDSDWTNISNDGWGVILSDANSTDPVTTRLCTTINDKPVISMRNMFANSETTNIDTSSFNTSNVINMLTMFSGCSSITELDLSGFDFSRGNSFSSIASGFFQGTTSLKKVIAKNWILPADMSNSFFRVSVSSSSPIEEIDVTGWDLSHTTNATGLLGAGGGNGLGGSGLKTIKGLDTWDTSNITNMKGMFQQLSSLTSLDLSSFNTSNVTNMENMFSGSTNLETLDLSNFVITSQSVLSNIFADATALKTIVAKNWTVPSSITGFFRQMGAYDIPIEEIDVTGWDLSNCTSISSLFADGKDLKRIKGLNTWDTSNITFMGQLFFGLSSIKSIDISTFNTSKVTSIAYMFYECTSLEEVNISNLDLSYVSNYHYQNFFDYTFYQTTSLKKIIAKNWIFPARTPYYLFRDSKAGDSPIEEIDVTGWDLSSTISLSGVFGYSGTNGLGGTGIKRIIGLNTWNTSNITDMSYMFDGLSSLTSLDLSSFNMTNVTNTESMFNGCTSVSTAYGRTSADVAKLNASSNKPSNITFVVKS